MKREYEIRKLERAEGAKRSEWEFWEGPIWSQKKALKQLEKAYENDHDFAVFRVDRYQVKRGTRR